MVRKIFIYVFLAMVLGVLFMLGAGSRFKFFQREDKLDGAYVNAAKPVFSMQNWFDGKFQEQADAFFNEHIIFREWLIRCRNQIDFNLYGHVHAEDVFVGKDEYLFRPTELHEMNGLYRFSEEEWGRRIRQLKHLRQLLSKQNIPLIIVIAPAKSYFYQEHVQPDKLNIQDTTFYENFVSRLARNGISFIDMNAYFFKMKTQASYPLYCKTGIHWTEYGAIIAMDSIMRYAGSKTGKKLPGMLWNHITIKDQPSDLDNDVMKSINLLKPIKPGALAYPQLRFNYTDDVYKPNMLVVGDSYYHALFNNGIHKNITGGNSPFWYYCYEEYASAGTKLLEEKDFLNAFEGIDLVMMIYSPPNLFEPFWVLPQKIEALTKD